MKPQLKSIGVLTSGGDSPGMNAAIRAVARSCAYYDIKCMGVLNGFEGLINGDFKPLTARSVKHIINRGGTILGSARSERFRTVEGRKVAFNHFSKSGIEGLIVIGGDGSFTGAKIFSEEFGVPVMGIPGTIDNDLYGTDYTLGYDTATNTAMEAIDKLRDTATAHDRLFFVEVMGRDTGFIALRSSVATGAIDLILPSEKASYEGLKSSLEKGFKNQKTSNIVVVAEGNPIGDVHKISEKVKNDFPEIESRVTVLGHLQRGGSPSCLDRILAAEMGVCAVEGLLEGKTQKMVGSVGGIMKFVPLEDAIGKRAILNENLRRIGEILSI